jgi:dTMP kinase
MSQRAPFIVIEGLDRSGKTTQTYRLHETLKNIGVQVESIKFPGMFFRMLQRRALSLNLLDRTTAIGQMIDSYLRSSSELDDRAIHLLFSANRWELA